VAFALEKDVVPDPIDIGILRPGAVVQGAQLVPYLIEEPPGPGFAAVTVHRRLRGLL